jgi:PAS domain S-box-containing protein
MLGPPHAKHGDPDIMVPARILIVDDEPSIRGLLKQLLEKNGYVCTLASDAAQARAYLGNQEFDLLLCDIRMPGESGLNLIRCVRKSYQDTGILMVTCVDDTQKAATALEVGVYGYVIKPFAPSQILISTANALRRRELEINERSYRDNLEKTVQERTLSLGRLVRLLEDSQSALRRSEDAHKEQLSFLETLINAIPSPIFYKDADGNYQGCNRAFEKFVGLGKAKIVGKSVYDIAPKDLADFSHEEDGKLIRGSDKQVYETSVGYPDGSKHEVIFNKATYRNADGNLAGIVGVMLDITDLNLAERNLRESERSFRNLIENSVQGILIHRDMKPVFANEAFANIHGYSVDEIIRLESILMLIAPSEHVRLSGYKDARMRGDPAPVHYEYAGVRKDGSLIWLESRAAVVHWDEAAAIQLTVSDITGKKRNEEALRESEELFRAISESAQDAIIMMNHEGKISYWNRAAEKILGYDSEEVLGRDLHGLIVPERFREGCHRVFNVSRRKRNGNNVGKTTELSVIRKGGEEFCIELSLSSVNIKGAWHAVGIIRDVSDRKKGEESLRRAHTEMETMISGISSILIGISDAQLITQWNGLAEKTFGIRAQRVLGRSLSECPVKWELKRIAQAITECCEKKKTVRVDDLRFTRLDGREGFLGFTLNPVQYEEGNRPAILFMGADITEKRALEMQLAQARKLESIGQLAAGIAHEINTPTQYVGDNTRFLRDAFGDLLSIMKRYDQLRERIKQGLATDELVDEIEASIQEVDLGYLEEEIPNAIRQTLDGVERVSKIVRSMKEFSHPGGDEKTPVDINEALESTITVARNEWKYVAEMETDFDPSLPVVPCFPGELNQVFLNILVNAAHAIGDVVKDNANGKGTISVSTRAIDDSVEIRIRDTGSGIPEHIRSRVFDPFFTTKGVGKGTGQGLAIAHTVIVEKHGGSITFQSEQGRGTTFIIRIPMKESSS